MEVALSTASFYPDALTEEAVRFFPGLSTGTAEIFLGSYSEYEENYAKMLREKLDEEGVKACSIHVLSTQYEPQLFGMTDRQRLDAQVFLTKVLRCGQILGAKAYVFHGPAVRKQTVANINYKRVAKITDELADLSADYGIKFTWENVYWCWYDDPLFAPRLLEYSKSSNLYFTLDIKQAMKSLEPDPFKFLNAMGSRVANVHLCDYDANGQLMLPGRGTFPFEALREKLMAVGYDGPVVMEVYRHNYGHILELAEGLAYLRGIFE